MFGGVVGEVVDVGFYYGEIYYVGVEDVGDGVFEVFEGCGVVVCLVGGVSVWVYECWFVGDGINVVKFSKFFI